MSRCVLWGTDSSVNCRGMLVMHSSQVKSSATRLRPAPLGNLSALLVPFAQNQVSQGAAPIAISPTPWTGSNMRLCSVRFQKQKGFSSMTKDDIQLLFEYDRWANNRTLQAAATLSPEQFTRDLGGSFRSVRDALVHIIGSEWAWLTYWKTASPTSAFLDSLWDRQDALFRPDAFPDLAVLRLKWVEVENALTEFVNSITEQALAKNLPVEARQLSLAHLLQHWANHSTYHRGQIAMMMRQLGAKPLATDFAFFLLETSRTPATTS
jgi:uncharacterized damage-inducible protein DinB